MKTARAWTDGGGNTGTECTCAFVMHITENGQQETWEGAKKLPHCSTNNEAEYEGLVYALEFAAENLVESLIVHMDSMLIVQQVNKLYGTKNRRLIPYWNRVQDLLLNFDQVSVEWLEREKNKHADRLCRKVKKDTSPSFIRLWTPPLAPRNRPSALPPKKDKPNPFSATPTRMRSATSPDYRH